MVGELGSGPRVIYQGDTVILGSTRYGPDEDGFCRETVAEVWPNMAFPRIPVGIRLADAAPRVGDANTAILFNVGRPYRRVSIEGRGSWTEWIEVRPDVLAEIVRAHEPTAEAEQSLPFRVGGAPVPTEAYVAHRRLRMRLARDGVWDALALEETALTIVEGVLAAGFDAVDLARTDAELARERARRDAVFEVQALLNRRLAAPLTLNDISDAVGISPYHLCRIFRALTGVPMHRYRDRLRLRSSLERIAETRTRNIDVALDLGYANEAHFSNAFVRTFGVRPSVFRRSVTRTRR